MRVIQRPQQSEGHFWPAYVDALTNVILNLLFFVSVMAVCVFSLGLSLSAEMGSERGVTSTAKDLVRTFSMLVEKPAPAQLRFYVKPQAGEAEKRSPPALIQVAPEVLADAKRLQITFPGSRATGQQGMAPSEGVRQALRNKVAMTDAQLKLWVECECRDPVERRLAYFNIMSVRNALLEMGAAQEKISMQLVTEDVKVSNPNAVFIEWGTAQTLE